MPIWRKEREPARVLVHWIGMIGFGIGLAAFCGQLSGQPIFYSWKHTGAMAFPTAMVTMIYGIGLFIVSRGESADSEGG